MSQTPGEETMNARGLFAALGAIAWLGGFGVVIAGSAGCMAPPDNDDESQALQEEEDPEEPLDLTIDALDVVHGSLRIIATMTDGAADVSVRLGGDCEHHEVGGGISTPSTFVWAFSEDDVADALECGLEVRARARDGDTFVSKVATLDVATSTAPIGGDTATDETTESAPALQGANAGEDGIHLVFAPLSPSARLTTGDSVLEATRSDPDDDTDRAGEFIVPRIDFARSILRNRALYVDGTPFATSLSVAGMSLDGSMVAGEGETERETEPAAPGEEVPAPPLTDEVISQE